MKRLLYKQPIDLRACLLGGQAFEWSECEDGYVGYFENKLWWVKQESPGVLAYEGPTEKQLRAYLCLDEVPGEPAAHLTHERAAWARYGGLRILRQPFEHALVGFIISANNSLGSIRTRLRNLAERLSPEVTGHGLRMRGYPTLEAIAQAPLRTLKAAKLGYRAAYLKKSCGRVLEGDFIKKIKSASVEQAREMLMELDGVGPKVADCILVYGLGVRSRYPVDLWMERFCVEELGLKPGARYDVYQAAQQARWGAQAALMGQWIFEWKRNGV